MPHAALGRRVPLAEGVKDVRVRPDDDPVALEVAAHLLVELAASINRVHSVAETMQYAKSTGL